MRTKHQKVHERLERFEIGTSIWVKETQRILFNDLEEQAAEEGSTRANKGKTKYGNLGSIKMNILAFQRKSDPKAYLE